MSKLVSYGIFAAIVLGMLFPVGESFKFLIPILLASILFFSFLKLDFHVKRFFRLELAYYFLIGLLIIPFIVFLLTTGLDTTWRLGIFLVAITPTAISSPIVVDLIRGDRELVVSNVILYNLLSPLTYTVLLALYFQGSEVAIPVTMIFQKLSVMIFAPLFLALLVKKFSKTASFLKTVSKTYSPLAFIAVIGVAVSAASSQFAGVDPVVLLPIAVVLLALAGGSFFLGSRLSKKRDVRKSLSVIFGHKNSTLTVWIAISNFSPFVVIPMIIYIVWHHVINSFIIHKFSD